MNTVWQWICAPFIAFWWSVQCLYWINKARLAMGLRPIFWLQRGRIGYALDCPIANSFDGGLIGVQGLYITSGNPDTVETLRHVFRGIEQPVIADPERVNVPAVFYRFVTRFDNADDYKPQPVSRVLGAFYRTNKVRTGQSEPAEY